MVRVPANIRREIQLKGMAKNSQTMAQLFCGQSSCLEYLFGCRPASPTLHQQASAQGDRSRCISGYQIADAFIHLHERLNKQLFDLTKDVRVQALREAKKLKSMWSRLNRLVSQAKSSKDAACLFYHPVVPGAKGSRPRVLKPRLAQYPIHGHCTNHRLKPLARAPVAGKTAEKKRTACIL